VILSFLQTLGEWNIILLLIALLSVVGLAIFIERLFTLHKAELDCDAFLIDLKQRLKDQQVVEARQLCEETKGPIAQIVKAGLHRHLNSKEVIEQGMERAGIIEIANLEKNAKVLSMISHLGPLIGLLGTVLGFIQAFSQMRLSGLVDISAGKIGEAMEYALITTAAGLAVAIPAFIAYNYLVSRIESLVLEMQTVSSEVVDLLLARNEGW
jgi:biopolymer transport protein ExbB